MSISPDSRATGRTTVGAKTISQNTVELAIAKSKCIKPALHAGGIVVTVLPGTIHNSVALCAHVIVGSSAGCELWLAVGRKYIGCCHTGCCHHSTWKEACAPNADDSDVEGAVARRAVATVAAASLATAIVAAASVAVAISM